MNGGEIANITGELIENEIDMLIICIYITIDVIDFTEDEMKRVKQSRKNY